MTRTPRDISKFASEVEPKAIARLTSAFAQVGLSYPAFSENIRGAMDAGIAAGTRATLEHVIERLEDLDEGHDELGTVLEKFMDEL